MLDSCVGAVLNTITIIPRARASYTRYWVLNFHQNKTINCMIDNLGWRDGRK